MGFSSSSLRRPGGPPSLQPSPPARGLRLPVGPRRPQLRWSTASVQASTMSEPPGKHDDMSGITSHRPVISARRHVISAGHYLAAHAGFAVLEAGGNAIDAGVAAGLALGVLQSDLVNVAGVAPIILYHAQSRKVCTISGLGVWPKLLTPDYFMKRHGGSIPRGLL